MPRMGDLADGDYGYSDLGIQIGGEVADPKVTDYGQADLQPFAMGALAQQRAYQPTDARGTDLWGYQTAGGMITPQDIEKAHAMALSFSGGGLKTEAPKLGSVLSPLSTALPPNPRLQAQAEALRGKYPQYAETYPPTGPPALLTKLEGGKAGPEVPYTSMEEALTKDAEPGFFLSKKLTPEVEQFKKDRSVIQKNMDVHGYEPFFDPAKRFDVDPKHYGPFEDTGTAAAPATAKTDAEWLAKYGTAENRAKLQQGFTEGKSVPDSENWYHMGQLEKEYIKELGAEAGRAAFKREFGDMMAATTGGAAPYDNFLMSQYANIAAKQGVRLPERAYEMPFPIGGRYASGNIAQAQKYIDAGQIGFDPAVNPKRYDFSSAFAGNPNAMTIDEQMYGALRPTTTKASVGLPEWYGPATRVAREEALKAGVEPRGFQDVAWAGLKKGKTEAGGKLFDYEGPMINHINRSIETTHRLTGMPREEVVRRGLIRKEIPLYGIAGATTMGGLAAQNNYQPEE
jgi:hypothetical protein